MSKGLRVRDFVSGVMVGAILFSGVAYAASTKIDVSFKPIKFFFEGEEKNAAPGEQGFVYNGRTYVPLRFMSEAVGKEVTYYQGIQNSIYIGGRKPSNQIYINQLATSSNNLSSDAKELTSSFRTSTGKTINGGGFIIGEGAKTIPGSLRVEYNLNKEYKIFEAMIAPSEEWTGKEDKNVGTVKIYQNGHLIYNSGNIASSKEPIPVRLSLADVDQFKIEAHGRELGLVNARFLK